MSYLKIPRFESPAWLAAVRSVESCVRCGSYGVEAAHRDEGKGMGVKTGDHLTAALCPSCHHELGNGKKYPREERRNEMNLAILKTFDLLVNMGLVGLKGKK